MRVSCTVLWAVLAGAAFGAPSVAAAQTGVREVSASERGLVTLQTRLRYTTMIVLPDDEEILDVVCGDKDFWVISAAQNIAHIKPAKAGAETNVNLVTTTGNIYSFVVTERSAQPDLKVYVRAPENRAKGKPRFFSAAQMETVQGQLAEARAAVEAADRRADAAVNEYRDRYPTQLHFVYGAIPNERPFSVRAIWHDGQFTYLKSDATELPALYEVLDGKPAIVNFQVRNGTYVVPKVIDRGYLSLGQKRLAFARKEP
jgi:type IV secretory pathway VirB9-like protein